MMANLFLYDKKSTQEVAGKCINDNYYYSTHPILMATIVALYVLVVRMGPRLMDGRKPFKLTQPLRMYNVAQLICNVYMLYLYFDLMGFQGLRFWENSCYPATAANNYNAEAVICSKMVYVPVLYCYNKIFDLMDTIFFILRKKNSQLTFLHVFHHAIVIINSNLTLHVGKEEIFIVFFTLNTFIHVVMYAYYLLSTLGPSVTRHLWWKKYLTTLQIVQFITFLFLIFKAIHLDQCPVNAYSLALWGVTFIVFIFMFLDFYGKAYLKRD